MKASVTMKTSSRYLLFTLAIIALNLQNPAVVAVPVPNCTFVHKAGPPGVVSSMCRPALDDLFNCLPYLLGVEALPSQSCCSGLSTAWEDYPTCVCSFTYNPPSNISVALQQAMPLHCNFSADLCVQCPPMLKELEGTRKEREIGRVPLVAVIMMCLIAFMAVAISLVVWRIRIIKSRLSRHLLADRDDLLKIEGPTVFAYSVLKAATKSFDLSSKLGEGGFGVVYKGLLPDGSEVAVKQLSTTSMQGNEEFLNEVTLISGVQHKNLVKLRGFCLKGHERLLVYEFLANRSLYQALFAAGKTIHLDWATRVRILAGTARGLAYLHEGCQTRIVHRDIKSSNILLDKALNPKIADFGLARLFKDDQSHVSTRVAGTAGYLAPEYAMRGQLTEKADVFSFGIVALEIVSGRNNFNIRLPPEKAYLLDWTWKLHENGNLLDLLDPSLKANPYPGGEVLRVIQVALLCTQSVAFMRPSMSRVVSMLTGDAEPETTDMTKPRVHMYSAGLTSGSRTDTLVPQASPCSCSSKNDSTISIVNAR